MATAEQVSRFRSANDALVLLAVRQLRDFWDSIDPYGNPITIRDLLLELFPDLVTSYGDVAAVLAADFYDELRGATPSAVRFQAIIATTPPVELAQASTRWGLSDLFKSEPDPDSTFDNLSGALQRLVMQAGRHTIVESSGRDPKRTGFARLPVGVTCKFCTTLASRGFVYRTAETAGAFNDWHDKCDCIVIPGSNQGDFPEGYDLAAYQAAYSEGVGMGRPD